MADQRNSQTKWGTRIFSEKSAFQRLPFEVYIRRLSRHHYGKNDHVLYKKYADKGDVVKLFFSVYFYYIFEKSKAFRFKSKVFLFSSDKFLANQKLFFLNQISFFFSWQDF